MCTCTHRGSRRGDRGPDQAGASRFGLAAAKADEAVPAREVVVVAGAAGSLPVPALRLCLRCRLAASTALEVIVVVPTCTTRARSSVSIRPTAGVSLSVTAPVSCHQMHRRFLEATAQRSITAVRSARLRAQS